MVYVGSTSPPNTSEACVGVAEREPLWMLIGRVCEAGVLLATERGSGNAAMGTSCALVWLLVVTISNMSFEMSFERKKMLIS